ncbi:MAG: AtpZ/AtpI family protein [Bacteroidota bacterium]
MPKKEISSYAKYSGLAIQMILFIGLAVWGGMKLDAYLTLSFPIFTVVLSLFSVIGILFWVIRSLQR